jgi:eukaryotic-like serine/threonine-protein kinase
VSGETLGHFEILDKLGEGGMGVLYRARDSRLGRTVAIKVLRPAVVADPERTRRFVQEARAVSALNHPNIVTIHDIGEDPARGTWIAMECLDGESLRQRLERGRLAAPEALRIAVDIARGLAAAHAAGIVHRDVKPANVMITQSGIVKVLDFGVAKLVGTEGAATDSVAPTLSSPAGTRVGVVLGTPAYMSPEQAEGRPVDARSDVFSFGALLYEMLTGRRPFEGASELSLLSSILRETPPQVRSLAPGVDSRLEALVERCLAKDRDARYPSARALLPDLEACLDREAHGPAARPLLRPAWVAGLTLILVALAALGTWGWRRSAKDRWARREAIPEIQRLIDADEITRAFRLAQKARPLLAGDPQFEAMWLDLIQGATTSVRSAPAGASVLVKPYAEPDAEWQQIGKTPVEKAELPRVFSRFRIEKAGYAKVEVAFAPGRISSHPPFRLVPESEAPPGMVLVPGGPFQFHNAPEVDLPEFWLDRSEVTNRQYEAFVSGGGYRRPALWKHPFVRHGRSLSFDEAMALFRDGTGRPGPSTWELGGFPEGHADYPVSGISWYEAAAYAEFAGKSLPTLHHWYRAADLTRFSEILEYSNFGAEGPRPVGARPSLTSYGNLDMAGNVREWVWNADGDRRYTLGGAWSDPTYLYTGPDALDPMDRSAILGLRCALYPSPPPGEAFAEVQNAVRDLSKARAVDDAAFRIYSRLFDYDPADLGSKVESVDDRSEHWREERVSFAAAYGVDRIPARLFLPKNATPPFQTVVYFPPASALSLPSIDRVGSRDFGFLVRSGRAVLFPVYQQTYERRRPMTRGPNYYREVVTQRAQDVRRAIDFLESRPDVDHGRIAFYGLSMGADEGTIVGAVEHRMRTLVLVAAGLDEGLPPEVDGLNYAPRVRVPVLMINGRYDFMEPLETNQKPLFRLLGTPEKDKKHVVFDSGHVPPWPDVVRETLDWLDRYLGPVKTGPPGR